jgi:hypothetical protein
VKRGIAGDGKWEYEIGEEKVGDNKKGFLSDIQFISHGIFSVLL